MRIAFLGLGLIGGSVAKAIRSAPVHGDSTIVAWTPSGAGPTAAREAGTVDEAARRPEQALRGADLVILAAPPLTCVELVRALAKELRDGLAPGATVTDVASTKSALTGAAAAAGIAFVGGHPMAGRETSGFGAADGDLFRDRPWIITEAVGAGDPEVVRALAGACGAVPVELDAARHDRLVAGISHAPLLAAVALAEAVTGAPDGRLPDWPAAARLAASGWRDATRLAHGDAAMGAQIAATNAEAVAAVLRRHRDRVEAWIEALEQADGVDVEALQARLEAVRAALRGEPPPGGR